MRTGCSYMGQHDPRHLAVDLQEMHALGCDDVLLAAQEIDFLYRPGKVNDLPEAADRLGMRSIGIFWGVLNLFGGGKSSQFLLEQPEARQVDADGQPRPKGCYNNPQCVEYILSLVDRLVEAGYDGYFIDEPRLLDCYCDACEKGFGDFAGSGTSLREAAAEEVETYRRHCVNHYIRTISQETKRRGPSMETSCCLMPVDKTLWREAAAQEGLDNLGTDIYWANNEKPLEEMDPLIEELAELCRGHGKIHHEWLQCWKVEPGCEHRILEMGRRLVSHRPEQLYVWAYRGQVGMSETCAQPELAWACAKQVLAEAKA